MDTTFAQMDDIRPYQARGVNGTASRIDAAVKQLAASTTDPGFYKNYSHGTHVTGTIAAITDNNGNGISGISLNHELSAVSLYSGHLDGDTDAGILMNQESLTAALGMLISGSENQSSLSKKIVINYSMQDGGQPNAKKITKMLKSLLKQGYEFLLVVAAGNDFSVDTTKSTTFAAITDQEISSRVIVVAAASVTDGFNFQVKNSSDGKDMNYGSRIDVAAPGVGIWSTVPPSERFSQGKEYREETGTSMAAPHVTGTAALVWAANPNLTGAQVKNILVNTADIALSNVNGTGRSGAADNGKTYPRYMINAAHAVAEALKQDYVIQGRCGTSLTWVFDPDTSTLTVSGEGDMTDFQEPEVPWRRYAGQVKTVILNDGVTSIGGYAFKQFGKLNRVTFGGSLRKIGDFAFSDCESLRVLDLPDGVSEIGEQVFSPDLQILKFTGNPPKVADSFVDDPNATSVYYPGYNQSWQKAVQGNGDGTRIWNDCKAIPYGAGSFSGIVREKDGGAVLSGATVDCALSDNDSSSEKHTAIFTSADGSFQFENLKEGTYTVKFHKSGYQDVTRTLTLSSGKDVAWNDIQMEPVKPETHTLHGTVATKDSGTALSGAAVTASKDGETVATVTSIADGSFSISLAPGSYTVTVVCDGYENWQDTVNVTGDGQTLTVSLTEVKNDEPWTDWKFDEATGTLTITGNGPMENYTSSERPAWYQSRDEVKTAVLSAGITSIGDMAFSQCVNLTSLTIPDGVARIGYGAFENCQNLVDVHIPDSVTDIDIGAFFSCRSLTSVVIPDGVKAIQQQTFQNCYHLTSITIPDSVTSIDQFAFRNCESLTSVEIPSRVTKIERSVFNGCKSLSSVTIPYGVTNIGFAAFEHCDSLESITLPNSVTTIEEGAFAYSHLFRVTMSDHLTSIGNYAFLNCYFLTSISIPKSVTYIGSSVFSSCSGLESINYEGTETQWGAVRKHSSWKASCWAKVYFNE